MESKLEYKVNETPVLFETENGIKKDNTKKVLFKSNDFTPLSVVSDRYNVLSIDKFKEISSRLGQASGFTHDGFHEYNDGRVILSQFKNNNDDFYIQGEQIKDNLIIGTSFDGSTQTFIGTSTVLIRCMNQFSKISQKNKIRHTESGDVKLEQLIQSVEMYHEEREELYETFNRLSGITLTREQIEKAVTKMLNVKEDEELSTRKENQIIALQDSINTEINDLGMNHWALFNGFTRYTTHRVNTKKPIFGNIVGSKARLNEKAYKTVLMLDEL